MQVVCGSLQAACNLDVGVGFEDAKPLASLDVRTCAWVCTLAALSDALRHTSRTPCLVPLVPASVKP